MANLIEKPVYHFDGVVVDAGGGTVSRGGQPHYLRQQTFQVLLYLLEHRDRVVRKEELIAHIWQGTAVTDNALVQCIADIRRALGDDSRQPRFVKTLPKLGYRFIGAVEPVWPAASVTIETEQITSVEIEFAETDAMAEAGEGEVVRPHAQPQRWFSRIARHRRALVAAAVGGVVLIALAGLVFPDKLFPRSSEQRAAAALPQAAGKKMVAVMPFENLSAGRDLDWLREGLADMLINNLSRSKRLAILNRQQLYIALTRAGYRPASQIDLPAALEIARQNHIEALVLGSLAGIGESVRVDLRLYDAGSGELLATEHLVEEKPGHILNEIDLLSLKLAGHLGATPAADDARRGLATVMTSNLDAYRYYSLALEQAQMFQFHEAIALLDKALALDPQFAMAHAGYIYAVRMGEGEKGKPHLEKALALAERLEEKERLFISAWLANAALDLTRAVETYRELIARYPLETESYQRLGWVLEGQGQYEEALKVIRQGLVTDPEWKDLYNALGFVCMRLGRNEEALAAFKRYTELAPKDPNAWDSLGLFHQWVGQYDEAEAAYDRALAVNPESGVAIIHLGHLRLQQGRYRAACEQYRRFSQVVPEGTGRARAYTCLAWAYLKRGDLTRAGAAVRQEIRYNPALLWSSLLLALERRDQAAVAKLSESVFSPAAYGMMKERGMLRAWEYQQGYVSLRQGRAEEALGHFRAAVQERALEWNNDPYEDCLANAYLELGRWDEAIAEFERVLKLNPNYPLAHYHLAQAYEQKGETDRARLAYEQFLRVWKNADADLPEIVRARKQSGGQS